MEGLDEGLAAESGGRGRTRKTHECIDSVGAPMSTVLNPILLTNGPIVEPQAQSLRTKYSCIATPASAAIRRRGKTVCEVVA